MRYTEPCDLAQQLRAIRKQQHRTQEDVAAAGTVNRLQISQWESGRFTPTLCSLDRWAAAVGVRLVALPAHSADLITGWRESAAQQEAYARQWAERGEHEQAAVARGRARQLADCVRELHDAITTIQEDA